MIAEFSDIWLMSFHQAPHRRTILRRISDEARFSDALVLSHPWPEPFAPVLLSFDGEHISHAALVSVGRRAVTGKDRCNFSHVRAFSSPGIPLGRLRSPLREEVLKQTADATEEIKPMPLSSETWRRLNAWARSHAGDFGAVLAELAEIRKRLAQERSGPKIEILAQQRDAAGVVLEVAGFDRPEVLSSWTHPDVVELRSYLDGFSSVPRHERDWLEHDMRVFGDWSPFVPLVTGTARFAEGARRVTLVCVDGPGGMETETGVDLIYFFEEYSSFVMIQYKCMRREKIEDKERLIYRPDKQCREQLAAMLRTNEFLRSVRSSADEANFRLCDNPFLFKLCNPTGRIEFVPELADGLYFPCDHFARVLEDSRMRGSDEGVIVGRHCAPRWMSNTEFVQLASSGWIGSTKAAGDAWVSKLIRESIALRHSVVLGAILVHRSYKPPGQAVQAELPV